MKNEQSSTYENKGLSFIVVINTFAVFFFISLHKNNLMVSYFCILVISFFFHHRLTHIKILEWKEAFSLYDKKGNSTVSSINLGDLLRGLGQNPTQAEVAELVKETAKSKNVPETQGKKEEDFFFVYLVLN